MVVKQTHKSKEVDIRPVVGSRVASLRFVPAPLLVQYFEIAGPIFGWADGVSAEVNLHLDW